VRLIEQTSRDIKYMCLSHCWGSQHFIQTTKKMIIGFCNGIPWADLPQTFQDAISVTYRLGLRHVWIDSLRIRQDDIEDWRREGGKMHHIYSRAYLTIAASKAASADEGCFNRSKAHYSRKLNWSDGNFKYDIHVREIFQHADLGTDGEGTLPLMHRGWVFQERLLSPRIVHFAPTELIWECLEKSACECSRLSEFLIKSSIKKPIVIQDDLRPRSHGPSSQQHLWQEIVQQYSKRQLTYQKDIFPALQGIAKRIFGHTKIKYYAGLWEETFLQYMLWIANERTARPKIFRAPSWSWASVGGGGVFWMTISGDSYIELASVVSVCTTPVAKDSFGELVGA
ncbi:heterokaryon incompatibility protein-domain-containing protein, partial [Pyrenochaeta sp. MPI-SDFR-AT-0127]